VSETAIVAGVGPTIGEAVAREFHAAGMDVGLFARSEAFVAELADGLGVGTLAVPTDVTDPDAVEAGTAAVREAFGPISVLVCNADGGGGKPVDDASVERLRSIFDVRVGGTLACVRAALADLRETEGTVIVSGTTYADPPVTEQLEWGAVGRSRARACRRCVNSSDARSPSFGSAVTRSTSSTGRSWTAR